MMSVHSKNNILTSNIILLENANKIYEAFQHAQIPMVFVKGCAFLDTLYTDIGLREMCDIDVLVLRKDKAKAGAVLRGNGYQFKDVAERRKATFDSHYNQAFELMEHPRVVVELHTELCQKKQFQVDYSSMMERRVLRNTKNRDVPTLGPVDSMLSLVLHSVKESFHLDSLRLKDAGLILEHWKPDVNEMMSRAEDYGFRFGALYYLELLQRSIGTSDLSTPYFRTMDAIKMSWLDAICSAEPQSELFRRAIQLCCMAMTGDDKWRFLKFVANYSVRRIKDRQGAFAKT